MFFLTGAGRSQRGKRLGGRGKNIFLTDTGRGQGKCNGHDVHRSDEIAGSLHAVSDNPVGTLWKDGGGGTSEEFSVRSDEVADPHSRPVFAKIRLGERKPTQMTIWLEDTRPPKPRVRTAGPSGKKLPGRMR